MTRRVRLNLYYGIIFILLVVVIGLWSQSKSNQSSTFSRTKQQQHGGSCPLVSETFKMELPLSNGPLTDDDRETKCRSPECNLLKTLDDERKYAQKMMDQYRSENFKLSYFINKLVGQIDQSSTDVAYRKRLSNQYYPVQPFVAYVPDHQPLNLLVDDFSNKTFSESRFLAPTQSSEFYGDDVHSGSYLCDDLYPYTDRQVLSQYQVEVAPQVKLY